MHNPSQTAIVVPFYNGHEYLPALVESVDSENARIIIVDNSPAESQAIDAEQLVEEVTVLRAAPGIGFGRANNIGALYALAHGCDGCIFTNQDGFFRSGAIDELVRASVEHGDAVVSALPDIYETGRLTTNTYRFFLGQIREYVSDLLTDTEPQRFYAARHPVGACLYMSATRMRQVGTFEPGIHMYSEDTDLFDRCIAHGVPVGINPAARFAHRHSNDSAGAEEKRRINAMVFQSRSFLNLRDSERPLELELAQMSARSVFSRLSQRFRETAPLSPDLAARFGALRRAYQNARAVAGRSLTERIVGQAIEDFPPLQEHEREIVSLMQAR